MTILNYYKMMQIDQFLNQTIAIGKTNKLLNSQMYHHQPLIDIKQQWVLYQKKPVNRTAEQKQASMLKFMKTKARNKLIKEGMERIKSLPADQQLSKIEEFKTKYNISSEQLKSQPGFDEGIKGKDKKKKNITELNKQQGTGRNKELYEQQGGLLNSPPRVKYQDLNNPMIYSGDTKDLSALLSHNPSPAIKDLLQKMLRTNMVQD